MQITIDTAMIETMLKEIVNPTFMYNSSVKDLVKKAIQSIITERVKAELENDPRFMLVLKRAIEEQVKAGFDAFGKSVSEAIAEAIVSRLERGDE